MFGSIYRVLKDLQRDGYDVGQLPMNEEALIKSVLTQVRAYLSTGWNGCLLWRVLSTCSCSKACSLC